MSTTYEDRFIDKRFAKEIAFYMRGKTPKFIALSQIAYQLDMKGRKHQKLLQHEKAAGCFSDAVALREEAFRLRRLAGIPFEAGKSSATR